MTKEEQLNLPPMEAMRRLLDENRALVRLLSGGAITDDVNGAELGPCADTDGMNAITSAYRDLLDLLEILSATSVAASGEQVSGR